MATGIDLTAKEVVDIIHKVGNRGALSAIVKKDGIAVNINGATISYKAGTIVAKSTSDDITITDGPNGEFQILFKEEDAKTITTRTVLKHECNIIIAEHTYPLFDGNLTLETSLFQ